MQRITVRGHQLRVVVRHGTAGEGRPLVLCNGIGASLDLLQPFVDALDPALEVVRFDVPGVGASTTPPLPYRFATLACWTADLLTQLGYDEVDMLGVSWGGGLAQQFALQHRRRCARLVLVSTATGSLMAPARPRTLLKMATPRRYRDPEYAARVAAELYGGRMRNEPERVKALMSQERPGSGKGYALQLAAGLGWTSLPFLPFIRQPTLILAGDDDPLIPLVNARIMQRLLPRATLRTYPDGHLGLVTMADELGPVVANFLREDPVVVTTPAEVPDECFDVDPCEC